MTLPVHDHVLLSNQKLMYLTQHTHTNTTFIHTQAQHSLIHT